MDRLSLDRFAHGPADPQETTDRFVCYCACGCGMPIHELDVVIECQLTKDLYYNGDCFLRKSDIRHVYAGTREDAT